MGLTPGQTGQTRELELRAGAASWELDKIDDCRMPPESNESGKLSHAVRRSPYKQTLKPKWSKSSFCLVVDGVMGWDVLVVCCVTAG